MDYQINKIKEKLRQLDTVFFDLDGTLIDTEKIYYRFWGEASEYYGYQLNREERLAMRSRDSKITAEFFKSKGLDYQIVKAKRIELMDKYLFTHPIKLKKGVVPFLKSLKEQNKRLFIVSANTVEKSRNILKGLNIEEYFTDVFSSKDVKRGKPFPDVYLKASELASRDSKDVIVFEDSPNGLISAHEAGCFTIMVEDIDTFTKKEEYIDSAIVDFDSLK